MASLVPRVPVRALADGMAFAMLALERMFLVLVMGIVLSGGVASHFAELSVVLHMSVKSICRLVNVANNLAADAQHWEGKTYS